MSFPCALAPVSIEFGDNLADELLVRVLERCDRFARLLRITL